MIDYKALTKRLEMHAECHANVEPFDDEQRQWAADLRTVVSLLSKYESLCIALAEERKAAPQPQPKPDEKPVAWLHRLHFPDGTSDDILSFGEGVPDDFGEGELVEVSYPLYKHPAPQPQPCTDPACPCQDGDPCHYVDHGKTKAMPQPQPEQTLAPTMPTHDPAMGVSLYQDGEQPERQPVSEPTDRCKHGVRFPHECRECEAEPSIEKIQRWRESEGLTEREPQPEPIDPHMIAAEDRYPDEPTDAQHPDDAAVDRFAAAMKAKLAEKRAEGRGGWDDPEQCSTTYLATLLRGHVAKGDPLDVGNFAMMLWNRGGATNEAIDVGIPDLRPTEAQIEAAAKWLDHHLPPEIPACSNRTALAVGVLRAAFAAKEPK